MNRTVYQIHAFTELKKKKIAIWGLGDNFRKKIEFIQNNIKPCIYIDTDRSKYGTEISKGIRSSLPSELDSSFDFVIITPESWTAIQQIIESIPQNVKILLLNQIYDIYQIILQKNVKFKNNKSKMLHFSCDIGSCVCNLGCSYCYIDFLDKSLKMNSFFAHSIEFMLCAFSKARLGTTALFNIVGQGETLLKPGFFELAKGLLEEGHCLIITTNGTVTEKIEQLITLPNDAKNRISFHFSFHYGELKKRNLLNTFFDNYKMIREHEGNVLITFPGADEYIPYIDEIRDLCISKTGVNPLVSVVQNEYKPGEGFPLGSSLKPKEYFKKWEIFESKAHKARKMAYEKIYEPCSAGISSGFLNINTGELRTCSPGEFICNVYDDITKEIPFLVNEHECPYEYCELNNFFLSGKMINGKKLPTVYEIYNARDERGNCTFNNEMKKAMDYIAN